MILRGIKENVGIKRPTATCDCYVNISLLVEILTLQFHMNLETKFLYHILQPLKLLELFLEKKKN